MVPWQSVDTYKTTYSIFSNLICPDSSYLTVTLNDPMLGTATIDGENRLEKIYQLFDTATIVVTPAEHYFAEVEAHECTIIDTIDATTYRVSLNYATAYPTFEVRFIGERHLVGVGANGDYGTTTGTDAYKYGDTVTVEAFPAEGYYFVRWADGSTDNRATFICHGDTIVKAIFSPIVTPELCMVSVQNDRNVLLWNAEDLPIVSYTVYREGTVSGEYDAVATIPYAEAGAWTDDDSRPASRSYRYRLTATDTCGNESTVSGIHKTMHLTISQGVGGAWNLVWTPYEGAEYTTYIIYRGTSSEDLQQIDIMPSAGNTTYSDNGAPSGDIYYQIGVLMTTPCGDMAKSTTVSRSNIAHNDSGTNPEPTLYTVTVSSFDDEIGSVIPNGTSSVENGTSFTVRATANEGYQFVAWISDGTQVSTANPYTFTVSEDVTLIATFEAEVTQGIADIKEDNVAIRSHNGQIVVTGADDETVRVFDIIGRQVNNKSLPAGIYLVKVGNRPARKVVVTK